MSRTVDQVTDDVADALSSGMLSAFHDVQRSWRGIDVIYADGEVWELRPSRLVCVDAAKAEIEHPLRGTKTDGD